MAEILLSDYFAENGGAADDSADCSASIVAAMAALESAGGGVLRFPASGVCRVASKMTTIPRVPVTLDGRGGTVRFIGIFDRFWELMASGNTLCIENITFLPQTPSNTGIPQDYNATNQLFFLRGSIVTVKNCRFISLACSGNGTASGIIVPYQTNIRFESCHFNGCSAPASGVIRGFQAQSYSFKHCEFVDWVTINDTYYSKTPNGNTAWIRADTWHPQTAVYATNRLKIEDCFFDEGSLNGIICDGADLLEISGVGINYGNISGITVKNTRDARISQSWIGYAQQNKQRGIIAQNVGLLRAEGIRFADGVSTLALLGTTKRAIIENCYLQGNEDYPNGVQNAANALLEIDGVKYRNGMIAY